MSLFKLRPYQEHLVAHVMNDFKSHQKLGIILPTGAGKTEGFIEVSRRFKEENPDKAVLVLSHLSILTEQTYQRFKLRTPTLKVGIYQADQRPRRFMDVIISTMQTSRSEDHNQALKHILDKEIGLIIVDETHNILTTSYDKILSYFPNAKLLGCTATPFKEAKLMTDYFEKISYSVSMQELIDQGYLVTPTLNQIPSTSKDPTLVMAQVIKLYQTHEMGKRSIIYMKSIDDAKQLRNTFESLGIRAACITSDINKDLRNHYLNKFQSNEIQILCTVNVLTAGFDSPYVESIIMPYPTKSPTIYLQRIGRGLRLCPEINKTDCRIYVVGNAPSIAKQAYQRMHELVLNAGKKETPSYTSDYELMKSTGDLSERFTYTEKIVKAINHMNKIEMTTFAEILNQKEFPKRFLDHFDKFAANLPKSPCIMKDGDNYATDAQYRLLTQLGFAGEKLTYLTKVEASMAIGALLAAKGTKPQLNPHVFSEGIHKGKHVSQVPHAYRSYVKRHLPNSLVARTIRAWEQAQHSKNKKTKIKKRKRA